MKKLITIILAAILVFALIVVGCVPPAPTPVPSSTPSLSEPPIEKVREIIKKLGLEKYSVYYLKPEEVFAVPAIEDWRGEKYTFSKETWSERTWFVFVDKIPDAFWEHPALYIFIDAATGKEKIKETTSPPNVFPKMVEITEKI